MRRPRRMALAAALALGLLAAVASPAGAQTVGALQALAGGCVVAAAAAEACTGYPRSLGTPYLSPDGRHLYVIENSSSIGIIARDPATGALVPVAGVAGCIADEPRGACADGRQMQGLRALAFSSDGLQLYATAGESNAIVILDRDPATGALTQKAGTAGCINQAGAEGCQGGGKMLVAPFAIVVRPGGAHVYVSTIGTGGKALLVFARNPANGALAQLTGNAGTIHSSACSPVVACTPNANIAHVREFAFTPSGSHLFAIDYSKNALLAFAIGANPGGALTQTQCLRNGTHAGCTPGRALYGAEALVASADGRNLYTHSESRKAIGVFALNGASIAQLAGPSGCLGTDAAGNRADGCGVVDTIDTQSFGLAISPDGASVYLGGYQLAILARDAALGTLTGLAKPSGCILNAERNGCSAARYLDAPFRIAISADSRFVYAFAYDADAIVGFSRTPPDAPDGGGAGDGGDPAAAVPRAARVAWIRKARAVRVRFLATAGVAYRLTAVKGARTRSARCTTRVRMKALRGTCAIRGLAPGRWAFALTPALNGVSGDPTRKTLRIRARTARR